MTKIIMSIGAVFLSSVAQANSVGDMFSMKVYSCLAGVQTEKDSAIMMEKQDLRKDGDAYFLFSKEQKGFYRIQKDKISFCQMEIKNPNDFYLENEDHSYSNYSRFYRDTSLYRSQPLKFNVNNKSKNPQPGFKKVNCSRIGTDREKNVESEVNNLVLARLIDSYYLDKRNGTKLKKAIAKIRKEFPGCEALPSVKKTIGSYEGKNATSQHPRSQEGGGPGGTPGGDNGTDPTSYDPTNMDDEVGSGPNIGR